MRSDFWRLRESSLVSDFHYRKGTTQVSATAAGKLAFHASKIAAGQVSASGVFFGSVSPLFRSRRGFKASYRRRSGLARNGPPKTAKIFLGMVLIDASVDGAVNSIVNLTSRGERYGPTHFVATNRDELSFARGPELPVQLSASSHGGRSTFVCPFLRSRHKPCKLTRRSVSGSNVG